MKATPAAIAFDTAWSRVDDAPPPRRMSATAGFTWLAVAQSTPAITPAVVPLPLQSSTRTATSAAASAREWRSRNGRWPWTRTTPPSAARGDALPRAALPNAAPGRCAASQYQGVSWIPW